MLREQPERHKDESVLERDEQIDTRASVMKVMNILVKRMRMKGAANHSQCELLFNRLSEQPRNQDAYSIRRQLGHMSS